VLPFSLNLSEYGGDMKEKLFFDIGICPTGKACNLNCANCFWPPEERRESKFMAIEDPLFVHLRQMGVKECFIGGGEPFLYPKIGELLSGLSQSFSIRYLLTNGKELQKYCHSIGKAVGTLVISIDKMHEEATRGGQGKEGYLEQIFSKMKCQLFATKVRVNSVVGGTEELPFIFDLRDKISFMEAVKDWHIYPQTPRVMSEQEYCHIIDSINDDSPLSFEVKCKIPRQDFLQVLILPDYSVETLRFDESWYIKRKTIKDIFKFGQLDQLLQHANTIHDLPISWYQQVGVKE
jgi:sulfatase maturation enzyme AslB (radical SAM superfamily)